jgi:hypothetical protein
VEAGKPLEYIEATLEDIALANQLAHEVLGRSLDELPPQTRRVLMAIEAFVAERAQAQGTERALVRFSRRELREATGIGDTQLRLHLDRLVGLEYVLARRDGAGGRFVYELVYDGQGTDGRPFVPGLIDVAKLRVSATTREVAGQASGLAGSSAEGAGRLRADRGPVAGRSRGASSPASAHEAELCAESSADSPETHLLEGAGDGVVSYPHGADRDDALPLAAASRS